MATEAAMEQTLVTKGIKSTVYAYDPETGAPAGRHGRYGLGHIALFDWDDHVSAGEVPDLLRRADIRGPTVVWESSQGNLHGWNLTVRSYTETAEVLDAGRDDTGHNRIGKDRGWWRLRAGPKLTINDDIYKPSPEYVSTEMVATGEPVRLSAPHAQLAAMLAEHSGRIFPPHWPPEWSVDGDMFEQCMYSTFTDEAKAIARRAEG